MPLTVHYDALHLRSSRGKAVARVFGAAYGVMLAASLLLWVSGRSWCVSGRYALNLPAGHCGSVSIQTADGRAAVSCSLAEGSSEEPGLALLWVGPDERDAAEIVRAQAGVGSYFHSHAGGKSAQIRVSAKVLVSLLLGLTVARHVYGRRRMRHNPPMHRTATAGAAQ